MNLKLYMAIVETRRHVQESLLPVFDEIVQTCVKIGQGRRGTGNPFSSLQSYLDGRVIVGEVSYQRRSLLLAVHDMAQDREAPLALRRKALAQLIAFQVKNNDLRHDNPSKSKHYAKMAGSGRVQG